MDPMDPMDPDVKGGDPTQAQMKDPCYLLLFD